MDTIEQDPEEIPMDQVLAEIRQMLSAQTERAEDGPESVEPQKTAPIAEPPVPPRPVADVAKEAPEYFLLTPAMRCDLPPDSVKSPFSIVFSSSFVTRTCRIMFAIFSAIHSTRTAFSYNKSGYITPSLRRRLPR